MVVALASRVAFVGDSRPVSLLARCGVWDYGIEVLAIRSLLVKRGRIGRLAIDEPKVGRLRVGELVVEREHQQET